MSGLVSGLSYAATHPGSDVQTAINGAQSGARAGSNILGGSASFLGGGTADYLKGVGNAAGGAVANAGGSLNHAATQAGSAAAKDASAAGKTAASNANATGKWAGKGLIGITNTTAKTSKNAGKTFGNFFSGALNMQTLILLAAGVAVLYLLANSKAGKAAGGSVGDAAGAAALA